MNNSQIAIKNMVCSRCITSVESILDKLAIKYIEIDLGKVILEESIGNESLEKLRLELDSVGFEILSNSENILIEKIRVTLINYVKDKLSKNNENFTSFLETEIGVNYSKLARLFSSKEGKTIERYLIELKIEKAKEYIKYDELSLSQISYELNYSTPQHLSRQFKQITGVTPSEFKKNGNRTKLDKL